MSEYPLIESPFSRFTPVLNIAALANHLACSACDLSKDICNKSKSIEIVHKIALNAHEYALTAQAISNAAVNAANSPYNDSTYDHITAVNNCHAMRNLAICAYSTAKSAYSTAEMAAACLSAYENIYNYDDTEDEERTYNYDVCTDIIYAPIYPATDTEDD
jgi:hypothetical protein